MGIAIESWEFVVRDRHTWSKVKEEAFLTLQEQSIQAVGAAMQNGRSLEDPLVEYYAEPGKPGKAPRRWAMGSLVSRAGPDSYAIRTYYFGLQHDLPQGITKGDAMLYGKKIGRQSYKTYWVGRTFVIEPDNPAHDPDRTPEPANLMPTAGAGRSRCNAAGDTPQLCININFRIRNPDSKQKPLVRRVDRIPSSLIQNTSAPFTATLYPRVPWHASPTPTREQDLPFIFCGPDTRFIGAMRTNAVSADRSLMGPHEIVLAPVPKDRIPKRPRSLMPSQSVIVPARTALIEEHGL